MNFREELLKLADEYEELLAENNRLKSQIGNQIGNQHQLQQQYSQQQQGMSVAGLMYAMNEMARKQNAESYNHCDDKENDCGCCEGDEIKGTKK